MRSRLMAAVVFMSLLFGGCSGEPAVEDSFPPETATSIPIGPTELPTTPTVVAEVTPYPDHVDPIWSLRNEVRAIDTAGQLYVSGEATVSVATDQILCVWAGTKDLPFISYQCYRPAEEFPIAGEWRPYLIGTHYYPTGSEDVDLVYCTETPDGERACP